MHKTLESTFAIHSLETHCGSIIGGAQHGPKVKTGFRFVPSSGHTSKGLVRTEWTTDHDRVAVLSSSGITCAWDPLSIPACRWPYAILDRRIR